MKRKERQVTVSERKCITLSEFEEKKIHFVIKYINRVNFFKIQFQTIRQILIASLPQHKASHHRNHILTLFPGQEKHSKLKYKPKEDDSI